MKLVTLLVLLLTFNAFSQTLQFYMPKDGGQFLEVGVSKNDITIIDTSLGDQYRIDSPEKNTSIRFDKAISPFWSFGFKYTSTDANGEIENYDTAPSTTGNYDRKGPRDLPIYIYGLLGSFYWKAIYYHALEQAKDGDNKTNYSTGSHFGLSLGFLITPNTGVRLDHTPGYNYEIDDGIVDDDEYEKGAQTSFAFFKEFTFEDTLYGVELSYLGFNKSTRTNNDGGSGTKYNIKSAEAVKTKFYPAINFGSFQIISNISFTNYINVKDSSRTELEFGADFRFNF